MRAPTSNPKGMWRSARATATGLVLGSAACTLLLDRSTTQCQSDADCARFIGHPACQNGVCVKSGLLPADCFLGEPQQPQDFLNQCSTAQCLSFNDCTRLPACGSAPGPKLVPPPASDSGTPNSMFSAGDANPGLPSCADPANGRAQIVYMTGSSNFPPLLAKLAPLIVTGNGPTLIYQVTSSCAGVKSVFSANASDRVIRDPAPGASLAKYAAYFGSDGIAVPCTLGSGGVRVDIGESDIFSTTCPGFGPPGDNITHSLGPNQAMAFVVPGASSETAISQEAAREVFGIGGNNGAAAPWTNPGRYFIRNASTGTQQMIGHAIGVAADAFWGTDVGSASAVVQALKVLSDPSEASQAIGIVSVDWYDTDRKNLKALAFRASGQECAYLPDSTPEARDKRNVRDGHYPIWGPLHFYSGSPLSQAALSFLSTVSVAKPPQSVLDAFISAGLIPSCAMTVNRITELGELSAYAAPYQCGCYFEFKTTGRAGACTRCKTPSECPSARPACNMGYCEVQ